MRYLDINFLCRLTTDARFSAYKGSMLRGCLGAALRRGLCMTRQRDCQACILVSKCVYPRIFSPAPAGSNAVTAPFCLEPELNEKCDYRAGDNFAFKLKLFGFGCDYLPFFVQAWRLAGEKGMGSPDPAGKFVIQEITSQGRRIHNADTDDLLIPEPLTMPEPIICAAPGAAELQLEILTPLRHKSGNHFSASLTFSELFHLILRRIKAIHKLDGSEWRLEQDQYDLLLKEAVQIRLAQNNLRWQDWTRYSSRQEAYMKFGGLTGSASYTGNLGLFKNMLQFAVIAHIGKQTSFGLGCIDFRYNPK